MELNKILHPDLLPEEELHQILESLSIKIPVNLPKLELLEIFKKVAVPLPQRNKEAKSQLTHPDISTVIDLNELSLSNDDNDERFSSYSKILKIVSENEEKKHRNDLMLQFAKDCEKMIIDVENIKVSKLPYCKVALKRSNLSQEDFNISIKKPKYCEKLTNL